jgi:hypothetical protein
MKKVLVSIMVLSLVEATAAGAEAGIWHPTNDKAVPGNVLLTATAVTVFEIQTNGTPTYILCLENAAQPSDKMTIGVKYAAIANLLPEPATIALLGLSGFLMRRRKITSR